MAWRSAFRRTTWATSCSRTCCSTCWSAPASASLPGALASWCSRVSCTWGLRRTSWRTRSWSARTRTRRTNRTPTRSSPTCSSCASSRAASRPRRSPCTPCTRASWAPTSSTILAQSFASLSTPPASSFSRHAHYVRHWSDFTNTIAKCVCFWLDHLLI